MKGVPQGLACSSVTFATYLDYMLAISGLLSHDTKAYADDLVIIAYTIEELDSILEKLDTLNPFLQISKDKPIRV